MIQGLVRYPGAGWVVEFMQGNAPQIAWVLEEQNGRLRLLLPNRRETALQTARILPWPGPAYDKNCSRDAALDILERHKSRRDVANVDPLELWELAQGEVEQAPAEWFAELALSEPDMDAVAACGHALLQVVGAAALGLGFGSLGLFQQGIVIVEDIFLQAAGVGHLQVVFIILPSADRQFALLL